MTRPIALALLALILLSASCTPIHKIARALTPCQPTMEAARRYGCQAFGYCSETAGAWRDVENYDYHFVPDTSRPFRNVRFVAREDVPSWVECANRR